MTSDEISLDSEERRHNFAVLIRCRLEREEKERLEVARLEKLEAMKRQLEEDRARIKEAGGVVFKGTWCVLAAWLSPHPSPRTELSMTSLVYLSGYLRKKRQESS
jgi:hypothetical protein